MVLKVKPVTLRERDELEPMLVSNPDIIEEGLKIITHQHMTDSGPLDILAVDSEGTLVIIELKNEAAEGHLDQGLRYYDWFRHNLAWISKAYDGNNQINAESSPRLMLIAPAFTDTVKRIAKYVDVDLQLFEYHAFESENGDRGIMCTQIDFGQPPEPPSVPTIDKKLEYFQDNKVRDLFRSVLSELQQNGIEIKPVGGTWITFWHKGKRFMSMSPRRIFFVSDVLSPDGNWLPRRQITSRKEWNDHYENNIKKYLDYLDSVR